MMLTSSSSSILLPSTLLLLLLASPSYGQASVPTTISGLISQYSLTRSQILPQPSEKQSVSATAKYLKANWDLNNDKIIGDPTFVDDPFESNSTSAVLAIDYEKASYGGGGVDGGAQFYSQPLSDSGSNTSFGAMLLSYEVAFDAGFAFNKGGKLPGLRGGDASGCSGGTAADGLTCFSTRLMWRLNGEGEVYAYIPTPNSLCSESGVTCNDDYGTSLSRGSFTFTAGNWSQISLFVQVNNPVTTANGRILMFFNGQLVMSHTNLQIRAADAVLDGGMFFSTFFGGSDSSWASPKNQSTYFRNIQLQAGTTVSDGSGSTVSASGAGRVLRQGGGWVVVGLVSLMALTLL
ncbi:hypothetical protein BDY24DRAFT_386525 [Mrakia frigida]|uniref:uncharacterized protein n=1 Tax=Mrakia frigida TaxID=29902 RepID=UPI003FCC04CD